MKVEIHGLDMSSAIALRQTLGVDAVATVPAGRPIESRVTTR